MKVYTILAIDVCKTSRVYNNVVAVYDTLEKAKQELEEIYNLFKTDYENGDAWREPNYYYENMGFIVGDEDEHDYIEYKIIGSEVN